MPIQHGTITGDAVHVPYAGTFANAAARTGATGLDSTQHGKLFRQLDDNSLWMLASTSPLTWKSLSPDRVASAGYADNAGYANNAGNAGALNGKTVGACRSTTPIRPTMRTARVPFRVLGVRGYLEL